MRQQVSLSLSALAVSLATAALVVAVLAATVFDDEQAIKAPAAQAQGSSGRVPFGSDCATAPADAIRELRGSAVTKVKVSSREVWPRSDSYYATSGRQCRSFVVDIIVDPWVGQTSTLGVGGSYDGPKTGPQSIFHSVPISQSTCSTYNQSVRLYRRKSTRDPFALLGGADSIGKRNEPSGFVAACAVVDTKNYPKPLPGSIPTPSETTTYRVVFRAYLKNVYGDLPLAVAAGGLLLPIPP